MDKIYPIKFTVSATPSLNKLHSNRWQMVNAKKKYLKELRGYEVYRLKEKKKMKLIYERHGSRFLDQENWFGSTKVLTDAIKEMGLIVDDRQEWLDIQHLPQVKCKRGEEKTEVCLLESMAEGLKDS